jgi:enoyl-CoA hydratase/carnithine racemase
MGIKTSPYQNGDPRIGLGIVQSLTHTNMGFIPIWGPTELIPKLERHSKWGPHIGMGIPISVWVGICQYSKSGSPHTNMGFIPIWGPTYIALMALGRGSYIGLCVVSQLMERSNNTTQYDNTMLY